MGLGLVGLAGVASAQTFVDAGDLPTARQMHSCAYDVTTKTVYALGGNIPASNGLDVILGVNDSIGADYATIDLSGPITVSASGQGPLMNDFKVNCGSADDGVATYNSDGAFVYNGKVYMTPGNTNAAAPWAVNKILMTDIGVDGSLAGTWVDATATNPPPAPSGAGNVVFDAGWEVYNGRVYRALGREALEACGGGSSIAVSGSVVSAPINGDGTIGAWRTETALSVDRRWGSLYIIDGLAVFVGGYEVGGTTRYSDVYVAPVSSVDGTIGTWSLSANSYPSEIYMSSGCVDHDDEIYVLTGRKEAGVGVTAAYKTKVNAAGTDIEPWTQFATLPVTQGHRYGAASGGDGVYVITGGRDDAASSTLLESVWVLNTNVPAAAGQWNLYN